MIANATFRGFGFEVFEDDNGINCLIFYRRLSGPEFSASLACAEDTGLLEHDGRTMEVPQSVIDKAYDFASRYGY